MKGIAQPGIEQITKQQLGTDQSIAKIENAEDADGSAHDAGETEIFFVTEKTAYTKQEHTHKVQSPQGSEAGDILTENGGIKE